MTSQPLRCDLEHNISTLMYFGVQNLGPNRPCCIKALAMVFTVDISRTKRKSCKNIIGLYEILSSNSV